MAWGLSEVMVTVIMVSMTTLKGHGPVARGTDTPQTCLFLDTCVLPCSFPAASEEVIHWLQDRLAVHSYYEGQDHLDLQDTPFRGRTSLFPDQISHGNASLRLTKVTLQDQGRYKCYASTNKGNKESFIKLTVEAPVRSVDMQLSDDIITCSSRGIFPVPELTWSTTHPGYNQTQKDPHYQTHRHTDPHKDPHYQTHRHTDPQGLFSVSSSLNVSGDPAGVDYVCSVSTPTRTRRATWRTQVLVQVLSRAGGLLHCSVPELDSPPQNMSLTWRFNHSETILTRAGQSGHAQDHAPDHPQVQQHWREQVQEVSASGSLRLHMLTPEHQGAYTCELSLDGDSYLTLTYLRIAPDPPRERTGLIVAVCGAIFPYGITMVMLLRNRSVL